MFPDYGEKESSAGLSHIGSLSQVTSGVAAIAFFIMADRPATASWLSKEEKALAISRIKRETPAQVEVTEKLRKKGLYSGLFNINSALIAAVFFFVRYSVSAGHSGKSVIAY